MNCISLFIFKIISAIDGMRVVFSWAIFPLEIPWKYALGNIKSVVACKVFYLTFLNINWTCHCDHYLQNTLANLPQFHLFQRGQTRKHMHI